MAKFLVVLILLIPLAGKADYPSKLFVGQCVDKSGSGKSFDLQISKVMGPKRLCKTVIFIGKDKFYSACEYTPEGMRFLNSASSDGKIIFASWGIIKAASGEIDLERGFSTKGTYVCSISGGQG
jgi:hypothetical protein